ncbi:MAG: AAA family ATPase [Candidatus Omnitrophota bacterium]
MNLSYLLELDDLAKKQTAEFKKTRYAFTELVKQSQGKHYTGIIGSRGGGKTILLKQLAATQKNSFYISCDTLKDDLFETIKEINSKLKIESFLLDEIHFYTGFEEALKKAYDFLNIKIVFTSSVSLALWKSSYDLSRRIVLQKLYPFSFREFLDFKYGVKLKQLDLTEIVNNTYDKAQLKNYGYFAEYISSGILPFALDEIDPLKILNNILNTIINKDIPRIGKIDIPEIEKIEKMISFIGKSEIDGINYTSLSNNLKITKYKAEQYIDLLEKAFVLNRVMPKGTNVLKEPKIVMSLPYRLLFRDIDQCVGGLREDFFVESMRMLDMEISYLKNKRGAKTPDYILEINDRKIICEVGGKTKGTEQFKGIDIKEKLVFADGIDSADPKRPLMTVGLC